MIFFEDKVKDMADHVILYRVIEIVLIIIISELSYRFIEKPMGKITWAKTKEFFGKVTNLQNTFIFQKAAAVMVAIVFVLGTAAIIKAPSVKAENVNNSPLARQIKKNRNQQLKDNKRLIKQAKKSRSIKESKAEILKQAKMLAKTHPVNKEFEKYGISQVDLQLAQKIRVTAIGDSVMAGSSQNLKQLMPNMIIDAAVSRQLAPTIALFEQYKNQGALNPNVLVGLGTNGPFSMNDVDHLMSIVGDKRRVFWINIHVPSKDWQRPVNNLLQKASQKYKNEKIIDWYNKAHEHNDCL